MIARKASQFVIAGLIGILDSFSVFFVAGAMPMKGKMGRKKGADPLLQSAYSLAAEYQP